MSLACIDRCALLAWDPNYKETSNLACGSFARDGSDQEDSSLELFSFTAGVQNVGQVSVSST